MLDPVSELVAWHVAKICPMLSVVKSLEQLIFSWKTLFIEQPSEYSLDFFMKDSVVRNLFYFRDILKHVALCKLSPFVAVFWSLITITRNELREANDLDMSAWFGAQIISSAFS